MSIPAITYDEFRRSPQTYRDLGGPWTSIPGGNIQKCFSHSYYWSNGPCMVCSLKYNDLDYNSQSAVNISVQMSQYGWADTLDYTWSFRPVYLVIDVTTRTTTSILVQIGSSRYDDEITPASDMPANLSLNPFHQISHIGSTAVSRSLDETMGYIPINIVFKLQTIFYPFLGLMEVDFQITTPINNTVSELPNTPSPTTQVPTPISTTVSEPRNITSLTTQIQTPIDTTVSEPQNTPFATAQASMGAIVGAAIVVFLLVALTVGYIIYRRILPSSQKMSGGREHEIHQTPSGGDQYPPFSSGSASGIRALEKNSPAMPQVDLLTTIPSATSNRHKKTHSTNESHFHPMKSTGPPSPLPQTAFNRASILSESLPASLERHVSNLSRESGPNYGGPRMLESWAQFNRGLISEDMETKLLSAGYMPGDNPDEYTEEEWKREFGVTRLELIRLRNLYQGGVRAQDV